jgi:TRAP-type uncharacterized transport system fused permease subunit
VVVASATAAIGVGALAAGFGGWMHHRARADERIALVIGGLLLFYAGTWSDLAGLGVTAVVLILHFGRRPPATIIDNGT